MLETINTTTQTMEAGSDLAFQQNLIQTGSTATHTVGSSAIIIHKPGFYSVSFGADAAATTTAGNVTLQIMQNGIAVPGLESTATSLGVTTLVSLGVNGAIIQVCPCCAPYRSVTTITVRNTGVASTISNAYLTVTKIA